MAKHRVPTMKSKGQGCPGWKALLQCRVSTECHLQWAGHWTSSSLPLMAQQPWSSAPNGCPAVLSSSWLSRTEPTLFSTARNYLSQALHKSVRGCCRVRSLQIPVLLTSNVTLTSCGLIYGTQLTCHEIPNTYHVLRASDVQ